ncbi:hypothetical protein PMIT1342_01767 [Prochlorococcus marinus str. MIT 1342]|uniref:Uncharacterized protein n=1 Tax=Prochlorococcus marinus (strain MIT 9313) TaxID=74547 RepID=B9ERR8_PROMM|nr:hypothetical protein PMIT1312_02635 [Prochlorococcus marinus str. MIT 1312]KZR75595.1 hypothetical protein PMIT1323_01889 [Prochlorococcus marinus str. MIT 1323]KZR79820.1 hypothetical protein PMIT1327_01883 [Prochlorococcus marinus str. MIT 1327]KZR81429.1 hypothetical protein PMIT1342_01767 [Prochlorococcus marinus str. MIT 1342]CAX31967.1 Conserved hypothetical protein [Prochlorococcus marinus str. MIT 9313]
MSSKQVVVIIAQLLSAIVAGAAPLVWAIAAHPGL